MSLSLFSLLLLFPWNHHINKYKKSLIRYLTSVRSTADSSLFLPSLRRKFTQLLFNKLLKKKKTSPRNTKPEKNVLKCYHQIQIMWRKLHMQNQICTHWKHTERYKMQVLIANLKNQTKTKAGRNLRASRITIAGIGWNSKLLRRPRKGKRSGVRGRRGVPAAAGSLGGTAQLILAEAAAAQSRGCCPKSRASVLFSEQLLDYTVNPEYLSLCNNELLSVVNIFL